MSITSKVRKVQQKRSQKKIRQAIDNTKKYEALSEAERVRQKHLQAEIQAKEELEKLRKQTRALKEKKGNVNVEKSIKALTKRLKALDKKVFG